METLRSGRKEILSISMPRIGRPRHRSEQRPENAEFAHGDQQEGHVRPQHEDLAVGKIDHPQNSKDQGKTQGHEGIRRPQDKTVYELLGKHRFRPEFCRKRGCRSGP